MRWSLLFIFFWQSHVTAAQQALGPADNPVFDIAVWDSLVAAVNERTIEIWDATTRASLASYSDDGSSTFSAVCFGREPRELIAGKRSGDVFVWNMRSGEKRILKRGRGAVTSMDAHEGIVAVANAAGSLSVLDLASGELLFVDSLYQSDVTAVRFSHDGKHLFAGCADGTVRAYATDPFSKLQTWKLKSWVGALATGQYPSACTAGAGSRLYVLDVISGDIKVLDSFSSPVISVDYDHLNNLLVSTMRGEITVVTKFSSYVTQTGDLPTQSRYASRSGKYIRVAVATRSRGLMIIDAREMKVKESSSGRRR